ncbi:MAG: ABC transporter permease, partial [Dehalococcoidales bacterium]
MAEEAPGIYAGQLAVEKPRPFLIDLAIRLVKEKPLGTVGALIVLILLIVGIFATWIAPYGYEDGFTATGASRLAPMSWDYWLGADQLGRDVLSRIIWGAQISLFVGLGVSTLSTVISGFIGIISGYLGGKADLIIQRFVDAWMCFPGIFIMITLMALVGPGIPQVICVLGILYGITGSRTVRGAAIGIKSNVYLEAARAIGAPTRTILWKHVLPNIMAPLIIVFTSRMGAAILAEASISFLGYG